MKKNLLGMLLAIGLVFFLAGDSFAQGRGKGSGGGGNSKNQNVNSQKNNDDRNQQRSSKNQKRDETDRRTSKNIDGKDNRFNGLSRKTGMSPQRLQQWYESERSLNPNLTYGQFVAANMIGRNHKGISAQTILNGLRNGDSIGQVLRSSGWNDRQIKKERKRIKAEIDDDGLDDIYDDRDWN